jgi:hypothetical protein
MDSLQEGELSIPKLEVLSRTYAPVVSGKIRAMSFDPQSKRFVLEFIAAGGATIMLR